MQYEYSAKALNNSIILWEGLVTYFPVRPNYHFNSIGFKDEDVFFPVYESTVMKSLVETYNKYFNYNSVTSEEAHQASKNILSMLRNLL